VGSIHRFRFVAMALALMVVGDSAAYSGVEVVGEEVLFPIKDDRAFSARLTPGGRFLLYYRDAALPESAQLVVRDLNNASERLLDVGPSLEASTLFFFHPFDARGRIMVLPDYRDAGAKFGGDLKRPVQVVDLENGRVARTKITADLRYARLDPAGEMLIGPGPLVTQLTNNKERRLKARGRVDSVNPIAPIASFAKTKSEGGPALILWDYANDRSLAALPVHRENTRLDDYIPRWTSDGHYLYYVDIDPTRTTHEEQLLTRVWDVRAGKLLKTIPRLGPVAPGPSPTSMVLRPNAISGMEGLAVHDAVTGATEPIPVVGDELVNTWDGKIVYAKRKDGVRVLCIADLVMAGQHRQAPR